MPASNENTVLITGLRERREGLKRDIEERNGDLQELYKKLDLVEDMLLDLDPEFHAAPRRLAFLQPIDAAIVVLMESGRESLPEDELIRRMLAHGVCRSNQDPKGDIRRSFGRASVRKKLHFDKRTGYVSIAKKHYEEQVRKKGEGV